MTKQAVNRVIVSIVTGAKEASARKQETSPRSHRRNHDDETLTAAVRKSFNAGRRWGVREASKDVDNNRDVPYNTSKE